MCRIIKLGGNALSTPTKQKEALQLFNKDNLEKTIVVVSAIGRLGFPYATDTLSKLIEPEAVLEQEKARLLACGEIVASVFFSNLLNQNNIKAISISPTKIGFLSDSKYLKSYVYELDNSAWSELLNSYDVLVMPGFLAVDREGDITLLGRGGSDLSAIFLAEVCKIDEVTLFKDVDGVFVTHGGNIKQEPFEYLSYQEMIAMENIGFKIINLDAIKEAMETKVNIVVRNINGSNKKTIISDRESSKLLLGINIIDNELYFATLKPEELITQIEEVLNKSHIYLKDKKIFFNHICIKLNLSQIYLAKRLVLDYYYNQ